MQQMQEAHQAEVSKLERELKMIKLQQRKNELQSVNKSPIRDVLAGNVPVSGRESTQQSMIVTDIGRGPGLRSEISETQRQ